MKTITPDTVECNGCGWSGTEEDLMLIETDKAGNITAIEITGLGVKRRLPQPESPEFFKGCPNGCETDAYLMDIPNV